MQTKTTSLLKGIGIGMLSGAAVTFTVKALTEDNNKVAKGSAKAVKAIGEMFTAVQTMFK